MNNLLNHPDLRRIVYQPKQKQWKVQLKGEQYEHEGRMCRKPDTVILADTLEEAADKVAKL